MATVTMRRDVFMTCTQALLSLFLLSPCEGGGSGSESVHAAVSNPDRPPTDIQRDADRNPAGVLSFLGIDQGMTVLDVFAGGGYYTEILNSVVGKDGKVLSHNNEAYLTFVAPQLEQRFAHGRLENTEQVIAEAGELELTDNSLDGALMILAYHDFFFGDDQYGWPDADESVFLGLLCKAMKPGAVLGVADHIDTSGGDAADIAFRLHRIDPQQVISDMTGACFDLEAESNILRNTTDDHSQSALSPEMRGKTDRFVYKFVRR
jgi:predicted methyltransferase